MSCLFSGKRKQDNDEYTNMLLKFPKYSDDTIPVIVKGTIIEYDDSKKMCKINFDDEDDVLNLPLEKVHSLIKQYNFYSAAGIIYNTCAVLIKDMSPCVVNTLVCATSKINYILVATTCEFNKTGFRFDGELVGDSIILNKHNFENNCTELDLEAIACDENNNIYVSNVLFCAFVSTLVTIYLLNRSNTDICHLTRIIVGLLLCLFSGLRRFLKKSSTCWSINLNILRR